VCMMALLRPNTFVMDFGIVPGRPKKEEIHRFIYEKLELSQNDVKSLQISYYKRLVFIETTNLDKAVELVETKNLKQSIASDNIEYPIKLYMEDCAINVKIHDLPPNMNNDIIKRKISEYGEVLSVTDEVWDSSYIYKDIKSGVRIVRMRLNCHIPSFISVEGEHTYITYTDQILTCRWCGFRLHPGTKCSDNRGNVRPNLTPHGRVTADISYADSLKTPASTSGNPSTTQTTASTTPKQLTTPEPATTIITTPETTKTSSTDKTTTSTPTMTSKPAASATSKPLFTDPAKASTATTDNTSSKISGTNIYFAKPIILPTSTNGQKESILGSWTEGSDMETDGNDSDMASLGGSKNDLHLIEPQPKKKRGRKPKN
jgi:hypothetical protein